MSKPLPWTLLSDDELRSRLAQRNVGPEQVEWCVKGRDDGDPAIMAVISEALDEVDA